MLRRHRAVTVAIRTLGGGEHALAEARRAQQHFANARNFDNVYADGNDHKRRRTDAGWLLLATD